MSKPELNPEIRELMDACRPNGEDAAGPEMAALEELLNRDPYAREVFSRSEHLDRSIGEAFRDVQTPPGLAARLLAAVGAEDEPGEHIVAGGESAEENFADEQANTSNQPTEKVSHAAASIRKETHRTSRRRWVALAGTLAASLVVVVYAAIVLNKTDGPIPHSTVADKAIAWLGRADQDNWNRNDIPPKDSYPLAEYVTYEGETPPIVQWQFIRTDYGKAAVYDLTPPGKRSVYLFSIRSGEQFSAPQLLPSRPARSTQGVCIGVAYRDGILHVLVVEGDERRYSQFIREPLPVI